MSTRNFSLLNDKPLASEVALASWCPTMDLVSLVLTDGQLLLHRLNWQRLWIHSPESLITCQCWRPDGKALATGHKDGSVALHDVENGEIKHKRKLHKAPICAISWVEDAATPSKKSWAPTALSEPLVNQYFPPKAARKDTSSQVSSSSAGSHKHIDLVLPVQPPQLTILVTADTSGAVVLSVFGAVHIADFNLQVALQDRVPLGATPQPCKVTLLRDLKHIVMVHQDSGAPAGESQLTVFHTDVIAAHSGDVRELAEVSSKVMYLLQGAQKSVETCWKEWRGAMQDFQKQVTALRISMEDHGMSYIDPQAELLCLLAAGTMSPAGSAWLTGKLGESSLRRLAKTVDSAVCNIHGQLLEQLQPICEMVGFLLGELKGLARCKGRLEPLGVQEDVLATTEQLCMQLLLSSDRLRLLLMEVGAQYRSFFSWLLSTIRLMEEDGRGGQEAPSSTDIAAISNFLANQFLEDAIGPKLEGSGFVSHSEGRPVSTRHMERVARLMHVMYGDRHMGNGRSVAELMATSLQSQVRELHHLCESAFSRPSEAISPSITPVLHLPLLHSPSSFSSMPLRETPPARCLVLGAPQTSAEGNESCAFLACLAPAPPHLSGTCCLLLLRVGIRPGQATLQVEGVIVRLPAQLNVVDVSFYRAARVTLLVDGWAEGGSLPAGGEGSCCLLMMPFPEEHLTPLSTHLGQTELLQSCLSHGSVVDIPTGPCSIRQRRLSYPTVQPPLAVSGPRGVACVFAGMQHVLMFDLEEDESEMERDEDEENEGMGEEEEE